MLTIKQLEKKYILDIKAFEVALTNYSTYCTRFDNPQYSVSKAKEAFDNLNRQFDLILRICADESNVVETAKLYSSLQKNVIPHVNFVTNSTNMNFSIGRFREFYIVVEIINAHNIKLMQDPFWGLLFKLSTIGKFEFRESEKPEKGMRSKYPQLFNKRGNYYKLIRNYFLNEVEYGRSRSLGYISVSWDLNTPAEKLIVQICEAFKAMYKLNMLLWRPDNKTAKL